MAETQIADESEAGEDLRKVHHRRGGLQLQDRHILAVQSLHSLSLQAHMD